MRAQTLGLRVSGTIFGIMGALQLVRLVFLSRVQVTVAGYEMPLWPNAVAFGIMAALCVWMWKLSYSSGK